MTTSNFLSASALLSGTDIDRHFVRGEPSPPLYRFVHKADEGAARADLDILMDRIYEKHNGNRDGVYAEWRESLRRDTRLMAAAVHLVFDAMIESNPELARLFDAGLIDREANMAEIASNLSTTSAKDKSSEW